MTKPALAILGGFVIGSIVGFAWSNSTKKRINENVKTDYQGGVVSIDVDIAQASKQGLYDMLKGKF